jgi:ATP-binding cassette subfamily A (ABC1) protein 3
MEAPATGEWAAACARSHRHWVSFRMLWWKNWTRLRQSLLLNIFLFILLPTLLVFMIGIARFGLQFGSMGIGTLQGLPTSIAEYAPDAAGPLVWADSRSSTLNSYNATDIIRSLAGIDAITVVEVPTTEALQSYCATSSCFAGISFHDSAENANLPFTANYTVHYAADSLEFGIDTNTPSSFQKAGLASLQVALDRALMSAALPQSSSNITAATVFTQSFTSLTQAQYNKSLYGYFYKYLGLVGAVAFTVVFLPQVFWLTQSIVSETELRLKESLFIMGLRPTVYFASYIATYVVLSIPSWLIMSALFAFQTFSADYISVLALIVLNALSVMALALLLTQFQQRARMASLSTMACLLAFGLIGLGIAQLESNGALEALASALLAPSGFVIGVIILARAEEAAQPVHVGSWWETTGQQNIAFGTVLLCMAVNIILMTSLAWYASNVVQGQFGVAKRWNFLCTRQSKRVRTSHSDDASPHPHVSGDLFELPTAASTPKVQIKHLTKKYQGATRPAVNDLNLDLYTGEIFVLLGRNGCGKTTTMSQMVGMLEPTAGDITINDVSVVAHAEQARQFLGFCPQHDVLWNDLTVLQTLTIFAGIKGVPSQALGAEVHQWIERLGLLEKANSQVETLSGGQKRRLSLCSAFVGGSQLIILDEPTAGVDPHSRRAIWSLIQDHKESRTILMSTHFLDEADVLGDRVAIMGNGELRAVGSPLFLKHRLGFGHNLNLSFNNDLQEESVGVLMQYVSTFIPGCSEMSRHGNELVVGIPMDGTSTLPRLLQGIEAEMERFGIKSFGVNSASLQDTFLKLVGECTPAELTNPLHNNKPTPHEEISMSAQPSSGVALIPSTWLTLTALLKKRMMLAHRDKKTALAPIVLSVAFALIAAFGIPAGGARECPPSIFINPVQQSLTGSAAASPYGPNAEFLFVNGDAATFPSLPNTTTVAFSDVSQLYATIRENSSSIWGAYIAKDTLLWPTYTAVCSVDYQAALPSTLNAITNSFMAAATGEDSTVFATTAVQPFPTQLQPFDSEDWIPILVIMSLCLLCCSLLAGLSSMLVTRERIQGIKLQQRAAGVSGGQYWSAHLLWDVLPMTLSALIIAAGLCALDAWWLSYGPTAALFVLFGVAATLLGYLVSFLTKTQAAALGLTSGYLFFVAVGFLASIFTLLNEVHEGFVAYIIYAGIAINPLCSLTFGIMYGANIVYLDCPSFLPMTVERLITLDYVGKLYIALGAQIILLAMAVLVAERWAELELWWLARRVLKRGYNIERAPGLGANGGSNGAAADDDVEAEVNRVIASLRGEHADADSTVDTGMAVNLRKEYNNGRKVAVSDLTLGFRGHEVFGLLGANGAGKTTTLRMITGQEVPTSGDAIINGHSLLRDIGAVQRSVGVCPQFDVLFNELTPIQHLHLFAQLKGLQGEAANGEVQWLISHLDLGAFAHMPSGALSGGNRRKLSVAIALVGAPPVLVLDEPSTGMDPAAKRFMWQVIQGLQRNHTTIITTHSMEECEAVSQRLGVMAAGKLAAVGGPQHLKNKFGSGYQVDAICGSLDDADAFLAHFQQTFPGVVVMERQGAHVRCSVPRFGSVQIQLGDILEYLESVRLQYGLQTFQAGQTSLEQVFLDIVRQSELSSPEVPYIDEARGTGDMSDLSTDRFTWKAIWFNLITAPVIGFVACGLVMGAYLAAICTMLLPPVGAAFARLTITTAMCFAQSFVNAAYSTSALAGPPKPLYRLTVSPTPSAMDTITCGNWHAYVRPLFGDSRMKYMILYQVLIQPLTSMVCCMLSAFFLAAGIATMCGFSYSCMLQRRLNIFQRRLAVRFCCA